MKFNRKKYLEYINNSNEWKLKRAEVFSLKGYKCERCGSTRKIHVHHATYERLFNELVTDLFTLCNSCHDEYHKNNKYISIKTTLAFIKTPVGEKIKVKTGKPTNKKKSKDKYTYASAAREQKKETLQGLKRLFYKERITAKEYDRKVRELNSKK